MAQPLGETVLEHVVLEQNKLVLRHWDVEVVCLNLIESVKASLMLKVILH